MSLKPVRIGFVGAGGNTRVKHIPGFKAIPGVQLVSVANRSRASSQKVADEFGIPKVYDDWKALVRADDIDAVCIGTWPYMHCEITVAALEAGKHVLTEARMAMDTAQAKTMLAASRKRPDLVTQIVPGPPTLEVEIRAGSSASTSCATATFRLRASRTVRMLSRSQVTVGPASKMSIRPLGRKPSLSSRAMAGTPCG